MKQFINVILFLYFSTFPLAIFGQRFEFNPKQLRLYWKDSKGAPFKSFSNVKKEHPELVFLMNAGMFTDSYYPAPVGLYVEKGIKLRPIKIVKNPKVNYGISPSGIFYFNSKKAGVINASTWTSKLNATYATQSGPMLLINGVINKNLPKGSYIKRNGVGVRADGKVIFGCFWSRFIDFAVWLKNQNCVNALYLDGVVSDYWTPSTFFNVGKFGPIIGAVDE